MISFAYVWLALLVLFLLAEAATAAVVSIWFAGGALVALLLALLDAGIGVQAVAFFLVSGVLLALLRPITRKYINPKIQATNVDALIGKQCVVTTPICNLTGQGSVLVSGIPWTARSLDDRDIPAQAIVKVERIEGVKLIVSPVRLPEES